MLTNVVIALPILGRPARRMSASTPNGASAGASMAGRAPPRAVRLSITDRCDLACVYCRPSRSDGYLPGERRLSVDHWRTVVEGLVARGVRRVRITGGEPLVHPDVVPIVAAIRAIDGVEDLAITTNGTRLRSLAIPLKKAGISRINVSIDSLRADRFAALTRGGRLDDLLGGIDAALAAGFDEVKTNTVVVGGENDDELAQITRWAWDRGISPRFLELMKVGEGARLTGRVVSYEAMRGALTELLGDGNSERALDRGPAFYVRGKHEFSSKRVGFITGSSATFCEGCDRLRVTSTGGLRPCLATVDEVDARPAIDRGDVGAIGDALDSAWAKKPDGTAWKGCTEASAADVNMRATGG